ncbi:DUF3488 domain-containing transglutaminase family protein [Catenovulum sp. SM1970]|uniref:transglutaminase family protein n=1 Tax=Marinifaba aquimaris TaxID=2741323 RepID=UPI001573CC8E|nr:DUF3488 and transglutaminase-like domain-containing protein [Marinifaba aquimaris]NTS75477.1 DUF3488 domain-containing transglutaminase family protein [Marinifaba aquimaris]
MITPNVSQCLRWLVPAQLIVQMYQAIEHTWIILAFYLVCLCLKWNQLQSGQKAFKRLYRILGLVIALVIVAGLGQSYGYLTAVISLLAFTQSLKLLEFESYRDLFGITCVQLFLIAAGLLLHVELIHAVVLTISLLLSVIALLQVQLVKLKAKKLSIYASKLMLLSLPLALLLFFAMPRLPPLWQMPKSQNAQTGLSETMKFGDIANLSRSNKLAFRATFDNLPPEQKDLYWRVLVHDIYDGTEWRSSLTLKKKPLSAYLMSRLSWQEQGAYWDYAILAEPSYQPWMFALDIAKVSGIKAKMAADFTWYADKPINQALEYRVRSYYEAPVQQRPDNWFYQINLQLPEQGNEKTRQWAQQLKTQFTEPELLIEHVLEQFAEQAYYYTLSPPRLLDDQIDEFLFKTKQGFCAHYASSFVFVMRAAGIPARVVAGYQGGEWNPKGEYFSVYQYDAHAWAEVYLPEQGWVRFDPTAYVAPERIEQDLSSALGDEEEFLANNRFALVKYKDNWLVNEVRLGFANINYQWSKWIVNYNQNSRSDFWKDLLRFDWWKLLKWLSLAIFVFFSYLIYRGLKHSQRADINKPYQQALSILAASGVKREPGMTARELLPQLKALSDESHTVWLKICQLIDRHEYQTESSKIQRKIYSHMTKQVQELREACKNGRKD